MDSLPVELLQLIFQSCDAESVRNLRLVTTTLAEVGYEYLLPPKFTALPWRDDVKRLHSIASHDRLRSSIEVVTVNLAEVNEYNARHASYFQHYLQEPEERSAVLTDAWVRFAELERRRKALPPFDGQAVTFREALQQLPNLREVEVTFTQCPFDIDVMKEVFEVPNCRKTDHTKACRSMGIVVSALQKAQGHVSSFTVDRLPLGLFRMSQERKLWFESAAAFAGLSHLDLTIDSSNITFPAARFKAVNGLGYVLRLATGLTHLSLAFHNYAIPKDKFLLWFQELLDDGFVFRRLTDIKLEGVACDEAELRGFLVRHGATLQRVRLGGRGLAKGYEPAMGGIHLCRGTFRSLFKGLRCRLPRLARLHLEGDFVCEAVDASTHECYNFHAITDAQWNDIPSAGRCRSRGRTPKKTIDGSAFERYLLEGGEYPGPAAAAAIAAAMPIPEAVNAG